MMKAVNLFYIVIIFCCQACTCNINKEAELIRQLNPKDTFVKDDNYSPFMDKVRRYTEEQLGLDSINNGFDSIEVRIWNSCAIEKGIRKFRLILLRLTNNEWKAELSDIKTDYAVYREYYPMTRTISYPQPRSGWNKFIVDLFAMQILSLPDFEKIQTYPDSQNVAMDGCGIDIELATKRIYRSYSYNTPYTHMNKYWQARNIVNIITLVNTEFEIKDTWPPY